MEQNGKMINNYLENNVAQATVFRLKVWLLNFHR